MQKQIFLPMVTSGIFVASTLTLVEYHFLDSPAWLFPCVLSGIFIVAWLVLVLGGWLSISHYLAFFGLMLCPPLDQWAMGGTEAAGAMMLWGIAGPFGAILFRGIRQASYQFIAFIIVCSIIFLLEFYYPSGWQTLNPFASRILLICNFAGFVVFIFFNVAHHARASENAMSALDKEHRLLQVEKTRSERLLLNILPPAIAERLKGNEKYIADGYDQVTILFADIVDFTPLSARLSPDELVKILNQIFSLFDTLAEKYGLEKIKTIGDAYMAAGGLPEKRSDHASACAYMALEMQELMKQFQFNTVSDLKLRIGLNSGPVVAGVIGSRKFIYDLWGDAVNTASRMESHGRAGSIQITESTYRLLGGLFVCEERGMLEIKGKGPMKTYILKKTA